MAAPIVVPFNFSPPISPSVKTTSYTVPTGKYAQVKAYFEGMETQSVTSANVTLNSRTITLNGVTILVPYSQGFSQNGAGNPVVTFPRVGRVNMAATLIAAGVSSAVITIGNYTRTFTAAAQFDSNINGVASSVTIAWSTGNGNASCTIIYDVPMDSTFWAKAGDVITGTGNWRALVTEYNVIS